MREKQWLAKDVRFILEREERFLDQNFIRAIQRSGPKLDPVTLTDDSDSKTRESPAEEIKNNQIGVRVWQNELVKVSFGVPKSLTFGV